ncbi:hypothetical protein HGM15179_021210 [Zosterops borbonicus]|uniref:Uncharacterized protein n=1 Tax=Zosterops borbonicus TaxID=364589 RepID=A0A8K1D5I2_9PASS|nr:hypothetical protein HGM15179_021210 [Zosterops borbonicus]
MSYGNGFSVLAWVKPYSKLLSGEISEEAAERAKRALLTDFCTLINVRWNMDCQLQTIDGTLYAYGTNARISASEQTIKNAIGDLAEHVGVLRGILTNTAEDLAAYRSCRLKWNVAEPGAPTTYGVEDSDARGTFQPIKRLRS